jgi:hypothetical protein
MTDENKNWLVRCYNAIRNSWPVRHLNAAAALLWRMRMFLGKLSVLFYFFAVSIAAVYATCTLWMATTGETPSPPEGVPLGCQDVAGSPPQITRLEPEMMAIGENYLSVSVFGCNFGEGARVRFNGVERASSAAGMNQLNVPLLGSDFAGAATVSVNVQTEAQPDKKPLVSNVKNLRIRPASDVPVIWHMVGRSLNITVELRLILLVLLVGGFSACVFGLNSFVNYAGERKLQANWLWLYFARPVLGAGIAFVFYLMIRGGFLAGTNADAKAVNPYGFVALAALVGMFSDAALMKLNEVFDTLFRARDTRSQALDASLIDPLTPLPSGPVNQPYHFNFKAKGDSSPFTWTWVTAAPTGWTLSTEGALSGTPTVAGPLEFEVQVKDGRGQVGKTKCTLEITK